MARTEWLTLLWNLALLITLVSVYGLWAEWSGRRRPLGRIANGLSFGLVAVLVMTVPLRLEPGLQYDGRSVVISMAGLFGGGSTVALAGALAALYRVHLGGVGVLPGLGTILTSALAGWGWRRWLGGRVTRIREWHLLVFGMVLHLAVLAWQAVLPGRYLSQIFLGIGPAFLSVYTLGTLLLGWLLLGVERRVEERRRDLEGHLREVSRLHEELDRRHRALAQAHEELGRHVATTAHDLKAPVRAILGFGRALEEDRGGMGIDRREVLHRITQAAERMEHLLEDLERYARVIQTPISRATIPVRALVQRVIDGLPEFLEPGGPRPHLEGTDDLAMIGDWSLLERSLANLLSNALKFTRPGETPRVEVRWYRSSPGQVRLEVRDWGIGVPEADRERIFEPYERLHGRETYPGSGLGLAMVRRAMERMHGRCGVEAAPGGGSVFFLELPEAESAR